MVETPKEKETVTVSQKKGGRKWLGRFGTFMMYGGWILVMIVVLGIVIAVSALTKGC